MAFFKFRQRGQPQPEPGGRSRGKAAAAETPQESIDSLRRRARHRLVGAAVLVLLAVIGFPLVFDTQPRPVAVDAPITIPDKDKVAPLRIPQPVPAGASLGEREEVVTSGAPAAPVVAPRASDKADATRPTSAERATEPRKADDAARAKADDAQRARREEEARKRRDDEHAKAEAQARRDAGAPAKRDAEAQAKRDADARAKREDEARAKREAADRARALLEGRNGKPSAPAAAADGQGGRFIVQVGAFAEDTAVREARQKAERAGVRTYTQVVNTAAGPRTRVRVGPFATREEAERAAATLKKAGLAGSVLSL
ncbi:MAG: SPOR domain-containing protein [Proteobacteria bacterium]|nr:SPOR domain-containing protein [Pseudomonadota bacterium]